MEKLIEIHNLKKTYKDFELNISDIHIKKNSITGIVGSNGAGKTTLIKCLLNIISFDCGSYIFDNKSINKNDFEFRHEIGYVGDSFDAYQTIKLSKITNFYKKMYKSKWSDEKYDHYIRKFELNTEKMVSELSKGMKVKYQFALALSRDVKLLLLDEPTSGLDPIIREDILEILRLENKKGTTVLFSTHITEDIDRIGTDLVFVESGELLFNESLSDVKKRFKITKKIPKKFDDSKWIEKLGDFYIIDTANLEEENFTCLSDELDQSSISQVLVYLKRRMK